MIVIYPNETFLANFITTVIIAAISKIFHRYVSMSSIS